MKHFKSCDTCIALCGAGLRPRERVAVNRGATCPDCLALDTALLAHDYRTASALTQQFADARRRRAAEKREIASGLAMAEVARGTDPRRLQ